VFFIPAGTWHVFTHEPGGFVDILFFSGQVDDIRPEGATVAAG
jgi:hypothetical protein